MAVFLRSCLRACKFLLGFSFLCNSFRLSVKPLCQMRDLTNKSKSIVGTGSEAFPRGASEAAARGGRRTRGTALKQIHGMGTREVCTLRG